MELTHLQRFFKKLSRASKFIQLINILRSPPNSKMMSIQKFMPLSNGSAYHQAALKFSATHGCRAQVSQLILESTTARTWHQSLDSTAQAAFKTKQNCKVGCPKSA